MNSILLSLLDALSFQKYLSQTQFTLTPRHFAVSMNAPSVSRREPVQARSKQRLKAILEAARLASGDIRGYELRESVQPI